VSDHANGLAAKLQTPAFPQALHSARPNKQTSMPNAKPKRRDKAFSKSRNERDDPGTRPMGISHNDRTDHAQQF
jgi:hypothetical protein